MARSEPSPKASTALLVYLLAVYGIAFVGYLGVRRGIPGWYDALIHPQLAPPPWVFGPIWSFLYLLIGYAGWQIWKSEKSRAQRLALVSYGVQLVLHSLWTWLFFGVQKPMGSLIEIGFLLLAILTMMFAAYRVRPTIAGLFLPYLVWVSFASYLNFGIWKLNYQNHEGVGRIQTIVNP